jgi:hypothetical protein
MTSLDAYVLAAVQQNQSRHRHRTMPRLGKITGFHTLHRIIRVSIDTLMVPTIGTNPSHPLGVVDRRNLNVMLFYHHLCREAGHGIKLKKTCIR